MTQVCFEVAKLPAPQVRLNDGAVVQTAEPSMVLVRVRDEPIRLLVDGALCRFLKTRPRVKLLGNSNKYCCRIDGYTLVVHGEEGRCEVRMVPNSAMLVTKSGRVLPLDYDDIDLPDTYKVFGEWMFTVGKSVAQMPGDMQARWGLTRFCG